MGSDSRRGRCAVSGAVALVLSTGLAAAQGFTGPVLGPPELVGGEVLIIAKELSAADLNGDGLPEYVARADNDVGVLVALNVDGVLQPPVVYFAKPAGFGFGALVGDLDADGALDVITGQPNGQAFTLLGLGDGTLGPCLDAGGLVTSAGHIAVGDVDCNGLCDVVSSSAALGQTGVVAVGHGLGDGLFAPAQTLGTLPTANSFAHQIQVHDLDADGPVDIVLHAGKFPVPNNMFVVFRGLGGGAFELLPQVTSDGGLTSGGFDLGDMDHDGLADLLIGTKDDGVQLALSQGGGHFGTPFLLSTGVAMKDVRAADIDVDGFPDIVSETGYVQRMGPGAQAVGAPLALGVSLGLPLVADFDGDALPDVAYVDKTVWPSIAYFLRNVLGPVIDLGYGTPAGPAIVVTGTPTAGGPVVLQVSGPPTGTPVMLVVGVEPLHAGLGGADLVPSPDALFTLPAGVPIASRWPVTLQAGAPLYLQALAGDTDSPSLSATLAVIPE
jgi:FG-GAP-like repeat